MGGVLCATCSEPSTCWGKAVDLKLLMTPPPTVAYYGTLLGSESTYMKEAPKSAGIVCNIAGIDPLIDLHCNPGQILPHFYVKNIFLAQILAELENFH